jgi:hypothetical protein
MVWIYTSYIILILRIIIDGKLLNRTRTMIYLEFIWKDIKAIRLCLDQDCEYFSFVWLVRISN